jgi:transcriptional regulator with XRE-family HTH domain
MEHPLKKWLRENGKTALKFAEEIGVDNSTLTRLIHGKTDVSTALIRSVSIGTRREVSERELFLAWHSARLKREAEKDKGSSSEAAVS